MKLYLFLVILIISQILVLSQMNYPKTDKQPTSEQYFGTTVTENYSWLEDDRSAATENWVKMENTFTEAYLKNIPNRDQIKKELESMYNYEKVSIPFQKKQYLYFYKNDGLQPHAVLYRKLADADKAKEEIFLDPNTFSKDGSVSLASWDLSESGKYLLYEISEGGADWRNVLIKDLETGKMLGDRIEGVKFSNTSWWEDKGFFYSTYETPDGSKLSAKTHQHVLKFHKLGTSQKDDIVVFGNEEGPKRYVSGLVSEDNKHLFISASNSTSGNEYYFVSLKERNFKPEPIITTEDADIEYLFSYGDMLYCSTNLKAANNRIVAIDLKKDTSPANWVDLIPENDMNMSASAVGDKIFCKYMKDANDIVVIYGKDGSLLHEINLPGKGSVSGFYGDKDTKFTFFQFENYITPPTTYKLDVSNFNYDYYSKSQINWNPEDYITEQFFYESKDGTEIPITISYKKGIELKGNTPTILYGYGGFNISLQPYFNPLRAYWISKGGILAVPNLRGGGEYGKDWHDQGIKQDKINVFDDFIAAAQFLIQNKFTSSNKLALMGGSNGGLLVGAVMTREPDLAAVALPAVGVLDMLKYHKFTSGAGWAYDYGTSEDSKEMFEYLYSYSPVHNIREGLCYPATLVTTGDHDDRVVPAHSFKFAAELQENQGCDKPILIRIETKAGHGAGKSTDVLLQEYADIYAFTWQNMNSTAMFSGQPSIDQIENTEVKGILQQLLVLQKELLQAKTSGNTQLYQEVSNKVIDLQRELPKYKNDPEFDKALEIFKAIRIQMANS